MAHVGVAPLTLVRTTAGRSEYVYAGQVAPEGILDEDLDRLVDEGYLAELDVVPTVTVVPDDPGTGNLGEGVTAERPKQMATKPLWVDYRVAQGLLLPEQAEEVTAEQLKDDEFMASYLQRQTDPAV